MLVTAWLLLINTVTGVTVRRDVSKPLSSRLKSNL
jgi:hypothetical protein